MRPEDSKGYSGMCEIRDSDNGGENDKCFHCSSFAEICLLLLSKYIHMFGSLSIVLCD